MAEALSRGRQGLLVASALVASVGAALGAVKALVSVFAVTLFGFTGSLSAFLVLWAGTEAGILLSCALGGAGFAFAGRASAAALPMIAGSAGVVASAAAFEPYLSPGLVPDSGWHAVQLFPAAFLLAGSAMAGLSSGR